jgi:predicted TIM-barrel fold metal-dependent hydrolase
MNDSHCHFFSQRFFAGLGRGLQPSAQEASDVVALDRLGWDAPGPADQLADRWLAELDKHEIARAALIASVPGDGESVALAVGRHPTRFVGFFMVDPTAPEAAGQAGSALDRGGLQTICLFPALHGYSLQDPAVRVMLQIAAARPGTAVFVHCGVLSIGARVKLGLPNSFDVRLGQPLDLQPLAREFSTVPIILPHFGAGLLREALMLADVCGNVILDTSSSNGWMRYHPGLTLPAVFKQALAVVGPERIMFGSDSSFFPRGWVKDVFEQQSAALGEIGIGDVARAQIFSGTFDRLFPARSRDADRRGLRGSG